LLVSDKVTELVAKEVNGHEQWKRRNDWFDEECISTSSGREKWD
jgi:hypothetical protein